MNNPFCKEILEILTIAQYEHLSNKDSRQVYQEVLIGLNRLYNLKLSVMCSTVQSTSPPEVLSLALSKKLDQPYWQDLPADQNFSWDQELLDQLLIHKKVIQHPHLKAFPLISALGSKEQISAGHCLYIPITYGSQTLGFMIFLSENPYPEQVINVLQMVCYFVGSFIHIRETEKKKIEAFETVKAHQKLLENFIHTLPVAVCILEKTYKYLNYSKLWQAFFSVKDKHLSLEDTLPKKTFPEIYNLLARTEKSTKEKTAEITLIQPKQKKYLVFTSANWIDSRGCLGGTILFCQDVTEERALRRQLNKTISKLSEYNQQLDYFAAICAHDLREPLRTISNYSQLVRNETISDQERKQLLNKISEKCKNLNALISGILSYSRLGQRSVIPEKINLTLLVQEVKAEISTLIEEKQAEITLETPASDVFFGDFIQMKQLFLNIVVNSIKYNKTTPHISLRLEELEDSWLFCVIDNGIGFSLEDVKKTNKFFRSKEVASYNLKGLGLMIINKIVKSHHGQVRLESTRDKGSKFYISLPKKLLN